MTSEIDFIDLSMWQGAGVDFDACPFPAIVKVSEGRFIDPQWLNYSANARAHGKLLGGYHFLDARQDPAVQAQVFLDAFKPTAHEVIVFDWETDSNHLVPSMDLIVRPFLAHVRAAYPNNLILGYGNEWLADEMAQLDAEFGLGAGYGRLGFWCAWYGTTSEVVLSRHPATVAWQFTSEASVPGIVDPTIDASQVLDRSFFTNTVLEPPMTQTEFSTMLAKSLGNEAKVEGEIVYLRLDDGNYYELGGVLQFIHHHAKSVDLGHRSVAASGPTADEIVMALGLKLSS